MSEQMKWTLLFCGVMCCVLSGDVGEGKQLGCFDSTEHRFHKVQQKLLRAHRHPPLRAHRHPPLRPVNHAAETCASFLSALSGERPSAGLNHRSLAPWVTRTVEKGDMFPPTYEEAECLCDGCIINGVENHSYNSVPVKQTRLFLKRVKCPSDPSKYSLEYEYVSVTVACTCAAPKS